MRSAHVVSYLINISSYQGRSMGCFAVMAFVLQLVQQQQDVEFGSVC
jgi:hypothetical protein